MQIKCCTSGRPLIQKRIRSASFRLFGGDAMVVFKNIFIQEKKNEELETFDKFYANFSTTRVCRVFHIFI